MKEASRNFPAMSFSSTPSRLTLLALLSATTIYCFYKSRRLRLLKLSSLNPSSHPIAKGKLIFVSQTGTSKTLAHRLHGLLTSNGIPFEVVDVKSYEPEDLAKESLVVIIASTWEDGKPPPEADFFANWLTESADDFRVGSLLLSGCRIAVFGVGSRAYGDSFNAVARGFSRRLRELGATEIVPLGEGDVDGGDLDGIFKEWSMEMVNILKGSGVENGHASNGIGGEESFNGGSSDDEYYSDEEDEANDMESAVVDLEDIAGKGPTRKSASVRQTNGKVSNGPKEMVTPVIRASLEKQGYKILGSHSGVKICRWTKSQLRGRGGCYKHSFYGIDSHRCMEATPSLACANKCVFCWRHHTNPVGKSWQWKMDDPLEILNSALEQHRQMIKQMKGVPGVTQERLAEGLSPRHCALSLVGEPIMYPEINTLIDELHKRRISTFLVTNAQFPEKIKSLKPITQLYVSVDAATKESLKAVDRPLFGDFWERFLDSLKSLRDKQQRTVYRLTLVKGWNTEELDAYFQLFSLGQPDLVEIKGVTYCGS
ncbi:S-adenosyl-L-methionine-dependent tRNA 4-demethylwyosine synthase [Linum grandiflorum]